jgi:hypothetical protein
MLQLPDVFGGLFRFHTESQKPEKTGDMGLEHLPNTIITGFWGVGPLKPKTENPPMLGGFRVLLIGFHVTRPQFLGTTFDTSKRRPPGGVDGW